MYTPAGSIEDPSTGKAIEYLQQIFSSASRACGFKFKYPGQAAVYPEIMESLKQTENLKVIELTRANVLKQAISLRNVGRIRKLKLSQSSNARQQVELEALHLDIPLTIAHAKYFLRSRADFREQIVDFPQVLAVTYESLLLDGPATRRRILEFLDVDADVPLNSDFRKTTPDRLCDAVQNYDELVAAVTGTELEKFLDSREGD
jgi:hypothetical protein